MNRTCEIYTEAAKNVDRMIASEFPEGLVMRWAKGEYKGRECVVLNFIWEFDPFIGEIVTYVRVATANDNGIGFMNAYDSFHLNYRKPEFFQKLT